MRIGAVEIPRTIALYVLVGLLFGSIGLVVLTESLIGGLVFVGFGAFFLFGATHSYLGARRYGNVALEVLEPAMPGGRLRARLVCPAGAGGASAIHAEVNCKKVEWIVSGPNRELAEYVIWTAKKSFPLPAAAKGAHCDVVFDLPADAPLTEGGSTETNLQPGVYWELQVETGDVAGVDLMRGFRFPVVAGTPAPSALMRPQVPPVTPSPERAARAAQAKQSDIAAGKAASYVAFAGAIALFAFMYLAQPDGATMRRVFVAIIAAALATYWAITWRNWRRQKAEDPDTPALTGAVIWHTIVLAAIAYGFW